MQGCEKQMGRLIKQDVGLSIEMLLELLQLYEEELCDAKVSRERKRTVIVSAGAFVMLFAGALRGGEVFMAEASEFVKRRDNGRSLTTNGHVVIPLMGRFKNETGERNLVIVLANVTDGGLQVRKWIDRLSALLLMEGKHESTGPAICDQDGYVLERWRLNGELHNILKQV